MATPGSGVEAGVSRAAGLREARTYLRDADPVLARLIAERPDFDPRRWMTELPAMDLFGALLFQITGQQLSVPATRRTLVRIEALFGGHLPSATELLGADPPQLRAAGRQSPLAHGPARRRSRQAARGRAVVAEDRHPARPRRAPVGRAARPAGAERPARRGGYDRTHRDSGDRPVDRAGRAA